MNIQNVKIELIQWLTTLEDISLIQKILELRNKETQDWWAELSDSEKKSIEKGLSDADNGQLKANTEVRKIYEKYL